MSQFYNTTKTDSTGQNHAWQEHTQKKDYNKAEEHGDQQRRSRKITDKRLVGKSLESLSVARDSC